MDVRTLRKLVADGVDMDTIAEMYDVEVQDVFDRMMADEELSKHLQHDGVSRGFRATKYTYVDRKTGAIVKAGGNNGMIIGKIGDEKVARFVQYHVDMLAMRQGSDWRNVHDLYQRFYNYLAYCIEKAILPNNMNAYFALGLTKQQISEWKLGHSGTPEHKRFAEDVSGFFSSIHEQAGRDGLTNPILTIFWQKAHDGLTDQPKVEVTVSNPLGEARSAQEIAEKYSDVELPD